MDIIDIKAYMQLVGYKARAASHLMAKAETIIKNNALISMATAIKRDEYKLLTANAVDLENAKIKGLDSVFIDRLTLTSRDVANMAEGLLQIAALIDPVGEISGLNYRPSGIQIGRMRVPLESLVLSMKHVLMLQLMQRDYVLKRATQRFYVVAQKPSTATKQLLLAWKRV